MPKARLYHHHGQHFTIDAWASIYGVPAQRIRSRLHAGWTFARALTEPADPSALTFKGQTLTIAQWADKIGVSTDLIRQRLKHGWTVEDTLTKPARFRMANGSLDQLTHNGETLPIEEWADRLGIGVRGLRARLRAGWSLKEALTIPRLHQPHPKHTAAPGDGSAVGENALHRAPYTAQDLP